MATLEQVGRLMRDATKEIERLRKENEWLKDGLERITNEGVDLMNRNRELKARVESLEASLAEADDA